MLSITAGVALQGVPVAFAAPAAPTAGFVKNLGTASANSVGSLTIPATGGVAAGNSIIVSFATPGGTGSNLSPGCTDTKGNTYKLDVNLDRNTNPSMWICSAHNVAALTGSDTITANFRATSNKAIASANEFSGLAASDTLDKTKITAGSTNAPTSGFAVPTTQADELLVGAISFNGTNFSVFGAAGTGQCTSSAVVTQGSYTATSNTPGNGSAGLATEYRIVNQVGSYAACATLSKPNPNLAAIATYRIAPQQATSLTLVKTITNDNGGDAADTDWTLTASGPSGFSGTTPAASGTPFSAGTYTLSESGPAGYAASDWACDGGNQAGDTVTLASGENVTCTIHNDDIQPRLTVNKVVSPASDPGRFNLQIDGTTHASNVGNGGTTGAIGVNAGSHQAGETAVVPTNLVNYTATYVGDCAADGSITLVVGDTKSCTITNTIKDADNDGIPDFLDCSALFENRVVDPNGTLSAYPHVNRYSTLQAAVNAAADNDVISMYGDTTENVVIGASTASAGKDLRVIGCGHKVTGAVQTKPVITTEASAGADDGNTGAGEADIHIENVSVLRGSIGFSILTSKGTGNNTSTLLKSIRSDSNGIGVKIVGNGNVVSNANSIDLNTGDGVQVVGNSNLVDNNRVASNSGDGIDVTGDSNTIDKNKVGEKNIGNQGNGISILGARNIVNENDVYASTLLGIKIDGNLNQVVKNDVGAKDKSNAGDGINVRGSGNNVDENNVFANGADGIDVAGGTSASPNVITSNEVGDSGKGNLGNGIVVGGAADEGNGTGAPVELDDNTVSFNQLVGILVSTGTHQLAGNDSEDNGGCEFSVVSGNFNATGNKANGTTIVGAMNSAFPTACQGTA